MKRADFKPLTLEDMEAVRPYLELTEAPLCDFMPGTVFMWRNYFHTQFCIEEETLYFRICYPDGTVTYTIPLTKGDLGAALSRLQAYVREMDEPFLISPVGAVQLSRLQQHFSEVQAQAERDWSDYIYDAEKMQSFSGKKLHGQRNHLNRFHALYPQAQATPITSENLPLCQAFLEEYAREQELSGDALKELGYAREVLANYDAYGLLGTCILIEGRVIAFAVGSIRGNMLYEHIEKATRQIPGAYQKIASEFAKMYAAPAREGVELINREDDMGDQSLRISKVSYHPVAMLDKFLVRVQGA